MGQEKPLRGMSHRKPQEVAGIRKTYHWLEKAAIKLDSTEALITRAINAGIYRTSQDPMSSEQS